MKGGGELNIVGKLKRRIEDIKGKLNIEIENNSITTEGRNRGEG